MIHAPISRDQTQDRSSHSAAVLVQTLLNRLYMAKVIVLASDMPRIRAARLLSDIERKRGIVSGIQKRGFGAPKYTFGILGPNGHGPGIEMVLADVARATSKVNSDV